MTDLPLFAHADQTVVGPPRARSTDPVTSFEAGDQAASFVNDHKAAILAWLKAHPEGGIKDEIAEGTGFTDIAIARRMKEMEREQTVERTGATRKTPTGRNAFVWRAR